MVSILVRPARATDAPAMSRILTDILHTWGSDRPGSAEHVLRHYVESPHSVRCSVALDTKDELVGFQALARAWDDNPYDVPEGWGVIGTYVAGSAAGQGVGRALFASTLEAAKQAGLSEIDATIGASNAVGLAYYAAIGFRPYREKPRVVCTKFTVSSVS